MLPCLLKASRLSFALFLSLLFTVSAFARPEPSEIVKMSVASFQEDSKTYLAVTLRHIEGWHTYWKNPGDSGLPTRIAFTHNGEKKNFRALEWPAPRRYIEEGNILVYGHSGDKSLIFELTDAQVQRLNSGTLDIHGTWLMCADICIPGEARVQGRFEQNRFVASSEQPYEIIPDILQMRMRSLPQEVEAPSNFDMVLARDPNRNEGLVLYTNLPDTPADSMVERMNLLTPFPQTPLDFRHEEVFADRSNTLYTRMRIDWDGRYQNPPLPLPADGKFDEPLRLRFLFANPVTKRIDVISKSFSSFSVEAGERLEDFHAMLTPVATTPIKPDESASLIDEAQEGPIMIRAGIGQQAEGLFTLLIFALIGGFILNLMPCVLPVISLKLFSLIQHKDEAPRRILMHNLTYTLGVLSTFWVLALVVILLKSMGEVVGWGFQLQSPTFVAVMALVIFVLALNMFGLFEFATPGGSKLGNVKIKDGFTGDFLSGVLATILSTPCSAPLLGTALTFAFAANNPTIFLMLTFVGLGLALPFLITGIFPSLMSFLPRPGMWMDHFKKFLGLTLILTVLWLLDVYQALVIGSVSVLKIQTLMALIFFTILMSKKLKRPLYLMIPLVSLVAFLFVNLLTTAKTWGPDTVRSDSQMIQEKVSAGLNFGPWSEEAMAKHRERQELVFMDFTAKWCLTCKVNERLVIDTQRFRRMVETYDVQLLLADWTRRDAYIGDFLQANGMVGVPAYFIQRPDGTLVNLGETLTFQMLEREFERARAAN